MRKNLQQLDANGDGKLETSEVATSNGYILCNSATENWYLYDLDPAQNALHKSGLIKNLRRPVCPETYDIPENTPTGRRLTYDRPDAVEILQREYAITRPGGGRVEYLQTYGAGPCVVLTLYDPATKTSVMAHVDAFTNLPESFDIIRDELRKAGVDMSKMEARLVGGDISSQKYISALYKEVVVRVGKIVEIDVVRTTPAEVMLDTNTGELYDYDETIHNTPIEKIYAVQIAPGPLRRSDATNILR